MRLEVMSITVTSRLQASAVDRRAVGAPASR